MLDLTQDQVARIAATVIGLGVDLDPGCRLCARGWTCPDHLGEAIARELFAEATHKPSFGGVALTQEAQDERRVRLELAMHAARNIAYNPPNQP